MFFVDQMQIKFLRIEVLFHFNTEFSKSVSNLEQAKHIHAIILGGRICSPLTMDRPLPTMLRAIRPLISDIR